mmetsp:Transcript_56715/g.159183  ORF Transcript_56715/g.159183 Transcript_56715/m.159183 type:complete len:339 (-) Transcript_56715:45-1061(-)
MVAAASAAGSPAPPSDFQLPRGSYSASLRLDAAGSGGSGSPLVEMFQAFPRESAIVMRRGVELGVVCNFVLVVHCAILVREYWGTSGIDIVLHALCLIRLALVAPRPYFWISTWRLFVGAGRQPTPAQIAEQLVDIYAHPFAKERFLLLSYYVWLVVVSAMTWMIPAESSLYAQSLWQHCVLSFAGIVLHRAICVALFASLVQRQRWRQHGGGKRRCVAPSTLDLNTTKVVWGSKFVSAIPLRFRLPSCSRREVHNEDASVKTARSVSAAIAAATTAVSCEGPESCSICLACYAMGEQLRVLRCGHYFHRSCVDTWLLKHCNSCPLCLLVVGPAAATG